MPPTPHVTRSPGSVVVNLTDDDCTHCMQSLAAQPGTTVALQGLFASAVTKGVIDCPQRHKTASVISGDGRYGITFRAGDDLASMYAFANLAVAGTRKVATAQALLDMVADLPRWGVTIDMDDEAAAAQIQTIVGWCTSPLSAEMDRWVRLGVADANHAQHWAALELPDEQVAAWIRHGADSPLSAKEFIAAGMGPTDVPVGVTRAEPVVFVAIAGVPEHWADLWMLTSPGFARIGHEQGRTMEEVHLLGHAVGDAQPDPDRVHGPMGDSRVKYEAHGLPLTSKWTAHEEQAYEAFATDLAGLDWADAATCLAAGMSFAETVEHLRDGRDMGPVEVLAGLTR